MKTLPYKELIYSAGYTGTYELVTCTNMTCEAGRAATENIREPASDALLPNLHQV